jgi:predicted Zn-dependent protease
MLDALPVPHEDGSFISAKVSRIAEVVQDYDHNVQVRWTPPAQRVFGDPAFAIVSAIPGQAEYVIFYVQDESEFDGRVLERLISLDAEKTGNALSALDARNAAVKAIQGNIHKERLEESKDLAYHILKSKKHIYRHDGVVYE